MSNQRHIFLSYRSIEVDFALKLAADLKNAGLNLWIDRLDIRPGEDWRRSLQAAVDECAALIAVLTPEYVASKYCQRELSRADRFFHPIIPLLLKPVPDKDWPIEIEREQYIDFSGWRDETVYRKKLQSLVQHLRDSFSSHFHDVPDDETRYLTTLVAELEASKGVMEFVELSHQANLVMSDEMSIRPRPRYAAAWTMDASFSVVPEYGDVPARPLRARVALNGIAEAVERYPRFVLTGAAGTGKTTTIQHLVLAAAYARLQDRDNTPLPLFLKLTNWHQHQTAEAFIRSHWPLSGDPIAGLVEGKIALFLDGLNEVGSRAPEYAARLREWLSRDKAPRRVIVTCRSSEYSEALSLHLPTVQVAEMDQTRIQQFVCGYLNDGAAERLLDKILPGQMVAGENSRHLFQMARNPFLLSVLVLVFMRSPDGELPQNTGALMKELTTELWNQERLRQSGDEPPVERLDRALSDLAFAMVDGGYAVYAPKAIAVQHLGGEQQLKACVSAKFLEEEEGSVRFAHQLVQEYYAALGLIKKGLPSKLEQPAFTAYGMRVPAKWDAVIVALCGILLGADAVVCAVAEVDPILALQCLASNIRLSDTTREQVVTRALAVIRGRAHAGRVQVASLLLAIDHEAALPVLLAAMRDGSWTARLAAYDVFRQTWIPDFPGLIEALQETSATMRAATVTALQQIGTVVLPNLLQLTRDANWRLQRSAAWALGEMRDETAVPALIELVRAEDPMVCAAAIAALATIADPASVPDLAEVMAHGNVRVRHIAAEALGRIGDRTAMAALIKASNDPDETMRCLAVEGLKHVSNVAAHLAILNASYDESVEVRGAVIEALKDTEDARAVNRLIELLNDGSWVRSAKKRISDLAASALTASRVPAALAAVQSWRKGRDEPASVGNGRNSNASNNKTGKTGKERLTQELHPHDSKIDFGDLDSPDWLQRRKAVRALANVDLEVALPKLITKLKDEDSQVRLAAVQVLSGIDNEVVTDELVGALGDSDILVCDAAAQALAGHGKKVVDVLVKALSSQNANVRGGAIEALAKIGDKSSVQPLVALLNDTEQLWLAEHRICDLAGRALMSIGTPDARKEVKSWRETPLGKTFIEKSSPRPQGVSEPEPEPRVRPSGDLMLELLFDLQEAEWGKREEAAKRLREYARTLKGKDVSLDVQRLIGATKDDDWVIRWAASDALAWIGDKSAVPAVTALLNDENWTVRNGALRNLIELRDLAAVPALNALAQDEHPGVREVVAEALGEFGDLSSLDSLVDLAQDEERFVRFAAIVALGKIGTEKATPPLVAALKDEQVTVRRVAIEAAHQLKLVAAVPGLIELLEDTSSLEWEDDRICDLAAAALEAIDTPEAKTAVTEWRRSQPELQ